MSNINFPISETVPIGSLVNARFKGNFHDATILDVDRKLKCKVGYMKDGNFTIVGIDSRHIKGELLIDNKVICDIDGNRISAVIKSVVDVSNYKLDFYDGDYGYAKRRQLLVKKLPTDSFSDPIEKSSDTHKDSEETSQQHHDNLNRPREESLTPLPVKRNTFNSLLSSLDSMDPNESSLIVNVLEMSFNDSKNSNPMRSTSASSNKSSVSLRNDRVIVEYNNIGQIENSSSEFSDDIAPVSKTRNDDITEDFVRKHVSESVLLKPQKSVMLDDLLEILHIEIHSKIIGYPFMKYPSIKESSVDIYQLFKCVAKLGGSDVVSESKQWKEVALNLKLPNAVPATFCCLKRFFNRWLQPYIIHKNSNTSKKCCVCVSQVNDFFIKKDNQQPTTNLIDLTPYKLKMDKNYTKMYKNEPIEAGSKKQTSSANNYRKVKRSRTLQSSDEILDMSKDGEYRFDRNVDDENSENDSSSSSKNNKKQTSASDNGNRNLGIHPIAAGTCVKIVAIRPTSSSFEYYVHYKGWNSRFDEWVRARFVELPLDSSQNTLKSPKSENNTSNVTHSSKNPSRAGSVDESEKNINIQKVNPLVVVQKRPKGRPPTKHLQQAANKAKLVTNATNSDEVIKRSSEKTSSISNGSGSDYHTNPGASKFTLPKETPARINRSKSPNTSTRHKNEPETSPNALLISNIGNSAGHRRTRNSLEDAILNAVLQQSVLESNKSSDTVSIQPNENNESSSLPRIDPLPIVDVMTPIAGSSVNLDGENRPSPVCRPKVHYIRTQSESDLGHHNKAPIGQQSITNPLKTTTSGQIKSASSTRGRKMKINSRKSSPSRKYSAYESTSQVDGIYTNLKYDGIKKSKLPKEKTITNSVTALNEFKPLHKDSNYNPPNYYKYNDLNETRRKRSAEQMGSNHTGTDVKVEDDIYAKMPSLSGNEPLKPKNSYSTKISKSDNGTLNNVKYESDNDQDIPVKVVKKVSTAEYSSRHKNLTKSSISFISKVNGTGEYLAQKSKTIDNELTAKPSLDNIRKVENFIGEIQQAYQKVKQKLRKLERGRKRYLQKNV